MKLNGWKPIGIASVIWAICAGYYTYTKALDNSIKRVNAIQVACDENLAGKLGDDWTKGSDGCNKEADESLESLIPGIRLEAAVVGFVTVPLCWGFVYLILFLERRVKPGFVAR